jgi:hypothetical protein
MKEKKTQIYGLKAIIIYVCEKFKSSYLWKFWLLVAFTLFFHIFCIFKYLVVNARNWQY